MNQLAFSLFDNAFGFTYVDQCFNVITRVFFLRFIDRFLVFFIAHAVELAMPWFSRECEHAIERLHDRQEPQQFAFGISQRKKAWNELTKYARQRMVEVPFCTLDAEGHLQRQAPERYPEWPLQGQLALVNFLQEIYVRQKIPARTEQAQRVTDLLILEMAERCRQRGVQFAMVLLDADDAARAHYTQLLGEHDIEVIDCARPLTPDRKVPGDGHPNPRLHAEWAECIATALRSGAGTGSEQ